MAEPPLRLLVVDDEPPARSRLIRLLAAEPGCAVIGQAGDGAHALQLAHELAPDALLLDVQMPEVSGLDVAASLPAATDGGPAVVFVTAFDRFALQAFDAAAVDYLLKPVDPARLRRALQRLRQRQPTVTAATQALPPQRLLLP
ncbi:MAG TPA: response regulator, partial [Rubrivivax sp.]|nr:response regulator [Rubrivivax sp.]